MQTYAITYTDGMYITLELSDEDYYIILECLMREGSTAYLSIGVMRLQDIRNIIKQKAAEENPSFTPEYTDEEKEYIKQMQWMEQREREMRAEHGEENE